MELLLGYVVLFMAFYTFTRACWIGFFSTPDGFISIILFCIAITVLGL
ncbi:gp47.1 hypothetical predicted membrane protein [Escherichia phage JS10]|uniref:Gp47.1 hypothetical predicted membrane protein n=2 Tax=Dhakavirus TaxID=1914165 RepID=C4MZF2_9CAUD|nr:gp47.1 hypothetical predicted membrane protein [Escherichia phage JS98]YP_002922406.1 gp47.1 hypothetical predicted membrane protein [Escherichia phage JS10]ABX11063.1 gp47.1 hypothetical predicted membrane protein [Escherichia phage JS98]ACL78283.1 gp47.1 hypothetical predicted membrane protein [Escherichia phage JS10]QAY00087.1 putative membrane protein [Escherichia phage EcWhh-1]